MQSLFSKTRAAGVFGGAAPPGRGLKTHGQLSCEQLIDRYAIDCRPVRATCWWTICANAGPPSTTPACTDCPTHWAGCSGVTWSCTTRASSRCTCPPRSPPGGSSGSRSRRAGRCRPAGCSPTSQCRASTLPITWSQCARSTSIWPSGPPATRPAGARGRCRARSATATGPSSPGRGHGASRGWTSAPASASRSFPRCWRTSAPGGRHPPTWCALPARPRPASCSPWPGRRCAARPGRMPRLTGSGRKTPAAAATAT